MFKVEPQSRQTFKTGESGCLVNASSSTHNSTALHVEQLLTNCFPNKRKRRYWGVFFLAPKKVQSKKTLGLDKATPTLCMNLLATCGLHRDTVK
ncbi:MAG: hypothetical protein L7W43_17530, partial [Rubripirellula sp.]|nr:hypothetical protein [Rubripirellula sp.]